MPPVLVPLSSLSVGDIIYEEVFIDIADAITSTSTTVKRIKKGLPIRRLCIVLYVDSGSVRVTYCASFDEETELPPVLSSDYWYPVKPAPQEGDFVPLQPSVDEADSEPQAGWVSLRKTQVITEDPVRLVSLARYNVQSVASIRAAMKDGGGV